MDVLFSSLTLENIPEFVFEDIKELAYEYFCRLQWIGQDYPHPHVITDYKFYIEYNTCLRIYNYLSKYVKIKLYEYIKNIDNNVEITNGYEESIIEQLCDEYIERFKVTDV